VKPGLGRLSFGVDAFERLPQQLFSGRSPRDWSFAAQYLFALLTVAAGLLARAALDPWLGDSVPYLPVFAALLVLVVTIRPGPFFVAAAVGAVGTWYLFIPVRQSFALETPAGAVGLVLFGVSVVCATLTASLVFRAQEGERKALRLAAEQREALRVTLASIGDAVITTDERGRVTFLNELAAALTGWSREAAVGQPLADVFDVIGEEARARGGSAADAAFLPDGASSLPRHKVLVNRNGGLRAIDENSTPIRGSDGSVVGAVRVFRDITARRELDDRLLRSERDLADFFENAAVGMHWVGPDGTVLRANHAELQLLGYSAEEYVGHHVAEFHADRDVINSILAKLERGQTLREVPARLKCKDGTIKDVLISSSVYRENGRFIHTRCFTVDVTSRKRAENALRESEQRFRLMADSAPVLIWVSGSDGNCTWCNRIWLEFVGRTLGQELGDGWTENVHVDDRPACLRTRSEASKARQPFSTEYRVRHRSGEYRWLLDSGVPRLGPDGEFAGYIGSCIDITERKRIEAALRRSESRFRRLADANLIGVGFGDGRGNVTYVNDEMLRMMGQRREDFEAGRVNWRQSIAPEFQDVYRSTTERLVKEGSVTGYEKAFIRPDGERTYYLGAAALLEPGSDAHVRIALDLTQLKHAQREREGLLERLREADRRKDEFLATLAHELRNPLAPLKNSLEIVKRAHANVDLLDHARETMERQLDHLVRLVDDLLDVSRITHNRLELRRSLCELRPIVEQAIQTIQALADARALRLSIEMPDAPIHLSADGVRLTQVFINLLENACKYTEPGGRVRLTVECSGSDAVVTVDDTGMGIDGNMLPLIFDMFVRHDQSLERNQGGLGLGLTLVRRLLDLHGGTIEAASEGPGRGSRFTVRLPRAEKAVRLPAVPVDPQTAAVAYRILVVDDNRDATESLTTLLQLTGHDTRSAPNGRLALEIAEGFRPEVILLDLGLPELNGYEVARRVRARPWGSNVALIALTGWGQEDDRRKSAEAGFDAHLVKPVNHGQLMEMLARLRCAGAASPASAREIRADRAA
jgi:PAS domain S-box-containing protein